MLPRGGTPAKILLGEGGPKVELNPKPKKIALLGQFDTLKNTFIQNMVP